MVKMLKICHWMGDLKEAAVVNFPSQVNSALSRMEPAMVAALYSELGQEKEIPNICLKQVVAFSKGAMSFELVSGSLIDWLVARLRTGSIEVKEDHPSSNLAVSKILMLHNWQTICYQYGFSGRKQAETALRDWVAEELA